MFYLTFILVEINFVGLTPLSQSIDTFLGSDFVINPRWFYFIHSFHKYLLKTYYMPIMILDIMTKLDKSPPSFIV